MHAFSNMFGFLFQFHNAIVTISLWHLYNLLNQIVLFLWLHAACINVPINNWIDFVFNTQYIFTDDIKDEQL